VAFVSAQVNAYGGVRYVTIDMNTQVELAEVAFSEGTTVVRVWAEVRGNVVTGYLRREREFAAKFYDFRVDGFTHGKVRSAYFDERNAVCARVATDATGFLVRGERVRREFLRWHKDLDRNSLD
jgi:hypothetical protein